MPPKVSRQQSRVNLCLGLKSTKMIERNIMYKKRFAILGISQRDAYLRSTKLAHASKLGHGNLAQWEKVCYDGDPWSHGYFVPDNADSRQYPSFYFHEVYAVEVI